MDIGSRLKKLEVEIHSLLLLQKGSSADLITKKDSLLSRDVSPNTISSGDLYVENCNNQLPLHKGVSSASLVEHCRAIVDMSCRRRESSQPVSRSTSKSPTQKCVCTSKSKCTCGSIQISRSVGSNMPTVRRTRTPSTANKSNATVPHVNESKSFKSATKPALTPNSPCCSATSSSTRNVTKLPVRPGSTPKSRHISRTPVKGNTETRIPLSSHRPPSTGPRNSSSCNRDDKFHHRKPLIQASPSPEMIHKRPNTPTKENNHQVHQKSTAEDSSSRLTSSSDSWSSVSEQAPAPAGVPRPSRVSNLSTFETIQEEKSIILSIQEEIDAEIEKSIRTISLSNETLNSENTVVSKCVTQGQSGKESKVGLPKETAVPNSKLTTSKSQQKLGLNSKDSTQSISSVDKYKQLSTELRKERADRAKTEKLVDQLRSAIETNQRDLNEMQKSKKAAAELAHALKDKYETIKSAREATLHQLELLQQENKKLSNQLADHVRNREQALQDVKNQACNEFKQYVKEHSQLSVRLTNEQNKILMENNEKLNRKINEGKDKLASVEKERDLLNAKIREVQGQATTAWEECSRLNRELQETKANAESTKEERNQLRLRIKKLEVKVEDIVTREHALQRSSCEIGTELVQKTKLSLELQEKCKILELELTRYQESDLKKVAAVELELKKFTTVMKDKEKLLLEEKRQLTQLVEELNDLVKNHKKRIDELLSLNKQQDVLIKTQQQKLQTKDNDMRTVTRITDQVRKRSSQLEEKVEEMRSAVNEVNNLRKELQEKDCAIRNSQDTIKMLEKELERAKSDLDKEKDTMLIKEKVIDDQAHTISRLKQGSKSNHESVLEIQKIIVELEKANDELTLEKQQKRQIMQSLAEMKKENEHLILQVNELEDELATAAQAHETGGLKQCEMLSDLEKKVQEKQKQWETQRQLLCDEKNQAVTAARFATHKLVETVFEFQNQVEAQKKVQKILTLLLAEKEAQLRKVTQECSLFLTSEITSVDIEENKFELPALKESPKAPANILGNSFSTFSNMLNKLYYRPDFDTSEYVYWPYKMLYPLTLVQLCISISQAGKRTSASLTCSEKKLRKELEAKVRDAYNACSNVIKHMSDGLATLKKTSGDEEIGNKNTTYHIKIKR